jgi:3-oxoacid CoA-transferase A subunit
MYQSTVNDIESIGDVYMKNKIYDSFDSAVADVFDGAMVAHSVFGPASVPLNLIDALSRKNVKDLTLVTIMAHPRQPPPTGPHLPNVAAINLIEQPGMVKRLYTGFTNNVYSSLRGSEDEYDRLTKDMEVIPVPFGNMCTRLEAAAGGYGGIITPVGVGTYLEDYCQHIEIDGKPYIIEKPLRPDFGLVKAWKADKLGNLIYHEMQRVMNPLIARASKVTIAEVLEIVEPGELDPDFIHTPHIYVDRIVHVPKGGMGSFEWDEVNKNLSWGPRGTRRNQPLK